MKVHNNCLDLQRSALLSQSRQRYNPTFVHQQIFNYQPARQKLTRCTPTFHSTALNTDGYNIQTQHKKNQTPRPQTGLQSSVYRNNSHQKRVQDLNPHNYVCSSSRQKWYDNTKKQIIDDAKQNNHVGYSRCRKIIDLSSDPVFTSYDYGKKQAQLNAKTLFIQKSTQKICNCVNCPQNCLCGCNCSQKNKIPEAIQKQLPKDTIINYLQNKQKNVESLQKRVQNKKSLHEGPDQKNNLKLKGKQIPKKEKLKQNKKQLASQKPIFTVVRKNRVGRA